jgi:hypothetical protein
MKAADAVQIVGSGTPSFFPFAGRAGEAAIVVAQDWAQDLVAVYRSLGPVRRNSLVRRF